MKFRFIYHRLSTGGIEHYIVNLTKELIRRNHDVELELITGRGHDESMLNAISRLGAVIIYSTSKVHMLCTPLYRRKKIDTKVTYVSFDWQSFVWCSLVYGAERLNHITGVYHIEEWNFHRWRLADILARRILEKINPVNFITCNELNQAVYGERMFGLPSLVPVGVNLPKRVNKRLRNNEDLLKIVLVGRIEGWKSFLYQSINYLKSVDYEFELHIIGDGRDFETYKDFAIKSIGEDRLKFYGNIDMAELMEMLLRVDLAITVGTSALLTAASGVPTIVGKENAEVGSDVNYGWLSEIKGYTYQEESANLTEFTYSLIRDFLYLSDEKLVNLKESHVTTAKKWDITVTCDDFLNVTRSSVSSVAPKYECMAFIFLFFLNRFTKKSNQYWTRRLRQD